MVTTDIERLEGELNEVLNEFTQAQNLNINLTFCENGREFTYTLTEDGQNFTYTFEVDFNNELERKRVMKRYAKLCLYRYLSSKFQVKLPWGALTGIRPTKLFYQQGENAERFLKEEMEVSEKKYAVLKNISEAQKPYYEVDEDNAAFYIGIPFCPTRCSYCSFISCEIGKLSAVNEYIDTLIKEIHHAKTLIKKLRSVYIGGGTPVSPSIENIRKVLEAVGPVDCEYTVEAGRADCINEEVLTLLKEYGVNRVCVNPQTFNDSTLQLMGRNHTAKEAVEKYHLAKSFGFKVNMDLIAGLPLETFEDFKRSLEQAIQLRPENITVHTLSLKKGSKLKELCDRLPEGEVAKMIDYSSTRLTEEGYRPYYLYRQKYQSGNLENTGYSLPGEECIYNIDAMEEIAQNIACGANAVSKRIFMDENRIERIGAPKDVKTYIEKIDKLLEEKEKLFKS